MEDNSLGPNQNNTDDLNRDKLIFDLIKRRLDNERARIITFKNSNTPLPVKRPKPKIEKIEFTEEQKEDIKAIMEGKPSKDRVQRWEKRGHYHYERHYTAPQLEGRIKIIRERYFKGLCHICQKFPLYKVSYKMPGISLVEYYCEKHFDKII